MDKNKNPLKVALHGMNERSYKMMAMYLRGPCKGVALVVNSNSAEVDIFDADSVTGQNLLREHFESKSINPAIILSLNDHPQMANALCVKKPVKTDDMLAVFAKAKALLGQNIKSPSLLNSVNIAENTDTILASSKKTEEFSDIEAEKPVLKKYVIDSDEQKKTSKHQAAMQLNEKGFGAFIGNVPGIDVNDPKQFAKANYNPKDYFQGYVESAFKVSREKGQNRQLNSGWNPLVIFPGNNEVWLDVDESQVRSFSGIAIKSTLGSKMSVTPLNQEIVDKGGMALERFQSMDVFLWKVACWASKGRYPVTIDIKKPVYLKSWPNFTRLLVTPHALRIAALLIQCPRTLPNVAEVLNIKPQYVFVFISAACSLGLAGQVIKEADLLVQSPEIKPNKNQGLLSRILSTLLGKKA
ncbi:MAG: hypothetical protein PHH59_03445 [Methylovulum sp.]|uniref:hypothetical protein n=1 Tax=Methylovulum sp. TaxID=1916980 RepID=UPI0026337437|nr:hypothetical protein [Methylovulum sp.]MDD2723063.1 hypothetical protein [Methylovulum sp.]MDD5123748.1 hypothetical protein [Methylovulum sp.]